MRLHTHKCRSRKPLPCKCAFKPLAGGCLSRRHRRKSCSAGEWVCLGRGPSQGNCATILGQRFPLGDILLYFKCAVRAPSPARCSSALRQTRLRELPSCLMGMTPLVAEWQRSGCAGRTRACWQLRTTNRSLGRLVTGRRFCVASAQVPGAPSVPLDGAQMPTEGHVTRVSHAGVSFRKTTRGFTRPWRPSCLSFPGLPAAALRMPAKCVSPGAAVSRADGAAARRTEQPQSGLPASWLDWRNF